MLLTPIGNAWPTEGWRVCAWGLDDYGLEKDFLSLEEAQAEYDGLTEPLLQEELLQRGYRNA